MLHQQTTPIRTLNYPSIPKRQIMATSQSKKQSTASKIFPWEVPSFNPLFNHQMKLKFPYTHSLYPTPL